jgi:low affinity Fe/Cu permease
MKQNQVQRRYVRELSRAMLAYIFILIVSLTVLRQFEFSKSLQVLISLSPAVPVAFVIIAMLRALRDSDELQQRVQLMATSLSAALTGFITFSYGFLENVGFPKFPTFLVFPMLVAIWGISLGFFRRRYQ